MPCVPRLQQRSWGLQVTSGGNSSWHWGDNGCYRSFILGFAPEGHALVILTNGANGQEVVNRMLCEVLGGGYPALRWLTSVY